MADENGAPPSTTEAVASAEVSHVIVRACTRCGGRRELDTACAGCGNREAPEVTNLGVVTAIYRNPLKRMWWQLAGRHAANHRIRRANARAARLAANRAVNPPCGHDEVGVSSQ